MLKKLFSKLRGDAPVVSKVFAIAATVGFSFLLVSFDDLTLGELIPSSKTEWLFLLIIFLLLLVLLFRFVVGYSQGEKKTIQEFDIEEQVETKLEELIEKEFKESFKDGDEELRKNIRSKLKVYVNSYLTDSLEAYEPYKSTQEFLLTHVENDLRVLRVDLSSHISQLKRSKSINLGFGSVISIAAIMILSTLFLGGSEKEINSFASFLTIQFPKITLAIFVEIFGFFFLRLYKSNHHEIKYYQNELTNVNSKILAVRIIYQRKDWEKIPEILSSLLTTERNFVLKKDETTARLELEKMEFIKKSNLADFINQFAPSFKSEIKKENEN